jgi:DNA-binding transcriptional ArsR family regulator
MVFMLWLSKNMKQRNSTIRQFEKILKALANQRRLRIVAYLKSVGKAPVWRIADEIGLSLKATSRHLIKLNQAEVLDKEQIRLEVFYCLAKSCEEFVARLINKL